MKPHPRILVPSLAAAALALGGVVLPEPTRAQEICPERYHVEAGGQRLSLPLCSTRPINRPDPGVRRIVFSLHGVATNAGTYFRNMVRAAERVPGAMDKTLILGPSLMTRAFAEENINALTPTDVFWNTSSDRFWGAASGSSELLPRQGSISSFELFDLLLADLLRPELFPNLEMVVLAGHSGGGQFMNRYAMTSDFEDRLARPRGIRVRYVVAQPSSHTYLTPERVDPAHRTRREFRVPPAAEVAACPNYDHYGTGLRGLERWPYLAAVGPERMREQYRVREVVYLHGIEDSDPQDSQLARGCEAMMQGSNRLERGITYFNYIHHLYGTGNHNHRISFVARVGHDHAGMWASDEGLLHIFDHAVSLEGRSGR